MVRRISLALALALVALLAGCKSKDQAPAVAATTPEGAVQAAVASLRAGDLAALVQAQVPPKHMDTLRAEWKRDMAEEAPSDEDRQQFAKMMADLTAPDANARLFAELEPQIVRFETEIAPNMPTYIEMGRGLLVAGIEERKDFSADQKQQAEKSVAALVGWLEGTHFTDRDKAKAAIAQITEAARTLELKTLDDARALDFDQALAKGSIAFRGLKGVLATYGFSIDDVLASVKTEVVSRTGNVAKVRIHYTLLGSPLSFETELVEVDGRWFGKQTIEELAKVGAPAAPAVAG
jgi:hypothetical protein